LKDKIKKILPDSIKRQITGLFYGWHGNFSTWAEAAGKCTGYESESIIEKVKDAAIEVKNGNASFERDSVLFYKPEYSYPLIASLFMIASAKKGKLNVLDFGGSLGSTYFQHHKLLEHIEINWSIVEQEAFVKEGKAHFEDDNLHFYDSVEKCYMDFDIDLVLLSSVLQYIEDPYTLLTNLISYKPSGIIIDRTPFITGNDRITIQKVHPKIYNASYPCWFLNKEKFLERILENYDLLIEFDALDEANIKSEFKGFLFVIRNTM